MNIGLLRVQKCAIGLTESEDICNGYLNPGGRLWFHAEQQLKDLCQTISCHRSGRDISRISEFTGKPGHPDLSFPSLVFHDLHSSFTVHGLPHCYMRRRNIICGNVMLKNL
jgi:hypothetical protein